MHALDFYASFVGPFETLGLDYMVTGSVAATVYGEPRMTHDVDVVLHLRAQQIEAFVAAFPGHEYYCPPIEVIRVEIARQSRAHFNLIHHRSGLKADCYLFTGDELQAWALKHRVRLELDDGAAMWLAPIEYVIVLKLEYFREEGSDKHLRDIKGMIAVSAESIDWKIVANWCSKRGLDDLLGRVRADRE